MKKIIYLFSILAAVTSCLKDDVKVAKEYQIDFRISVDSKAAETTSTDISGFVVSAFDSKGNAYFKNVEFEKVEGYDYFTAKDQYYYWPADKELTFFAYYPAMDNVSADVENGALVLKNFTVADNMSDHKDVVIAKQTEKYSENGTILEFEHCLSQIQIMAKNDNEGYVYRVKGVKIGKPASSGDYNFNDFQWVAASDEEKRLFITEYDECIELDGTLKDLMGESGNAMLLPQQLVGWDPVNDAKNANDNSYLSLLINLKTSGGTPIYPAVDKEALTDVDDEDPYAWIAVPLNTEWEAGYKYIYHLDFTSGSGFIDPDEEGAGESVLSNPVKFTVEAVKDWSSPETVVTPEI